MASPNKEKDNNALFAMSGGKKKEPEPPPMNQDQILNEFAPDPSMVVESDFAEKKEVEPLMVAPPTVIRNEKQNIIELPPRPPVQKRRNKKKRFTDIYTPITFHIDKRIAPALKDYLDQAESNTSLANQIFLKILLDAGYELDPTLLTKPPK